MGGPWPWFLYVIRSAHGTRKVGLSTMSAVRADQLRCQFDQPMEVEETWQIPDDWDRRVFERVTHRVLDDRALGGEWFAASLEEVRVAVAQARATIEAGQVVNGGKKDPGTAINVCIPEHVAQAARHYAVTHKMKLKEVVEEALRRVLKEGLA